PRSQDHGIIDRLSMMLPLRYSMTFLAILAFCMLTRAQDVKVMTYNLRFDNPGDGFNSWTYRKAAVAELIKSEKPAFAGTQEGLWHQLAYLDSVLTGYRYIGVGRDDGATRGEYCALFYDTAQFEV